MVPLVSLTFFTAVYLTTEAAKSNTCRSNAAMLSTIPGLLGKDDGQDRKVLMESRGHLDHKAPQDSLDHKAPQDPPVH